MQTGDRPADFEACMLRLDEIVRELETGQVPLEHAMSLFEEGLRLGSSCRELLDGAQARIEQMLAHLEGSDGAAAPPEAVN